MSDPGPANDERRAPLSREQCCAAVALADQSRIKSFTMRRLGQELGVEAISLYNHVANKDDILDGIVDLILGGIDMPRPVPTGGRMRQRCFGARGAAGPPVGGDADHVALQHRAGDDALPRRDPRTAARGQVLGRRARSTVDALDSHLYGFTLQQLILPFEAEEAQRVLAGVLGPLPADEFPNIVEVITEIMRSGRKETSSSARPDPRRTPAKSRG